MWPLANDRHKDAQLLVAAWTTDNRWRPAACAGRSLSVELVDSCIHQLHLGKACGPDSLSAEHLLYAHPSLVVHLKLLFGLIFLHGFVPDDFGSGIIMPLIKDKSGNMNDIHNYRPITLTPVISHKQGPWICILYVCKENFITDDLQCGFKKNIGCSDAVFAVKSTVNHFVEHGSCVYAAALDLKKAFDRVNHFKLFSTLIGFWCPYPSR